MTSFRSTELLTATATNRDTSLGYDGAAADHHDFVSEFSNALAAKRIKYLLDPAEIARRQTPLLPPVLTLLPFPAQKDTSAGNFATHNQNQNLIENHKQLNQEHTRNRLKIPEDAGVANALIRQHVTTRLWGKLENEIIAPLGAIGIPTELETFTACWNYIMGQRLIGSDTHATKLIKELQSLTFDEGFRQINDRYNRIQAELSNIFMQDAQGNRIPVPGVQGVYKTYRLTESELRVAFLAALEHSVYFADEYKDAIKHRQTYSEIVANIEMLVRTNPAKFDPKSTPAQMGKISTTTYPAHLAATATSSSSSSQRTCANCQSIYHWAATCPDPICHICKQNFATADARRAHYTETHARPRSNIRTRPPSPGTHAGRRSRSPALMGDPRNKRVHYAEDNTAPRTSSPVPVLPTTTRERTPSRLHAFLASLTDEEYAELEQRSYTPADAPSHLSGMDPHDR